MMKWWGWGDENRSFPMDEKPTLWPWIQKTLGITQARLSPPVSFEDVHVAPAITNQKFIEAIAQFLKTEQLLSDKKERLLHSYGKSFPDLFNVRRGIVKNAPDLVCLPESHEQVEKIIKLAHECNVCVIPFGGGTNIVGGINPLDASKRMIVSLDMRRMNQVLHVDAYSQTATIQAGALGPKLEEDLQKVGFSLGHYPDSFEYSTLGGWLATRSAGMQSDAYGKIEHMVVSLKLVTPSGTIETRTVPASSAGPDLNQLVVGSEGILGVITEATMRIHRTPAVKDYRGYLFKSFEEGVNAIHECIDKGFLPSMIRLQDSWETELAMNMKSPKKGLEAMVQKVVKKYLKKSGYTSPCIMVVGFEGDEAAISSTRKEALKIMVKHKGFNLGKSIGKTWSKDKFNVPYLRDYVMDHSSMADVAETSATWSNVLPLYHNAINGMKDKFKSDGIKGYIGCHISHTYKTGACLYFTYAVQQDTGRELEQYYSYKNLITETFLKSGGTLSHHHAIGIEHLPWMEKEVSPVGLQALRAVKTSLDPKGILNPGKLLVDLSDGVDLVEKSGRNVTGQMPHYTHKNTVDLTGNNNSLPTV